MFNRFRQGSAVLAPPIAGEQEIPIDDNRPPLDQTPKTKWQRRTPVIACGAGLFSDGYLNSAIGPVNTILSTIYPTEYKQSSAQSNVSAITFAGEVLGIAIFGFTSDHYSRKWSLFVSTIILFVFAALGAGSYGAGGSTGGLFAALTAYRFLLGIGIGGEYPAGSVGCAESTGELDSGKRNRWFIWFTNLQIDLGFVVAYIVAMVVVRITGEAYLHAAWRIILGLGIIPPLSLIYMRFKLKEPEAFQREKMTKTKMPWLLILRFYWFRLLIVSTIWFIYDFSDFAFSIYSTTITKTLPGAGTLWVSFGWGLMINAFYLPGAFLGSFVSDKIGPRLTLIIFITLQAITGYIMAGAYEALSKPNVVAAFCVVYGIFLSFGEAGPGDNIGLIASKTCATPVRGQYYAVAAAFGKVGAFVGTYLFPIIQDDGGSDPIKRGQYPFWVASTLCIVGAGLAAFCLPHIGQDTIDLEDRRFRAYLKEHGYDTSQMGRGDYMEDEMIARETSGDGSSGDEAVKGGEVPGEKMA